MAGASSLSIVYPLDCIRTRLSVDIGNDKNTRAYKVSILYLFKNSRIFKGFVDCVGKVMKNDGLRGFYKGYVISIPVL